jgi:uncharacterized membrane protein
MGIPNGLILESVQRHWHVLTTYSKWPWTGGCSRGGVLVAMMMMMMIIVIIIIIIIISFCIRH